jgi:multiple sugar transport system permease protein
LTALVLEIVFGTLLAYLAMKETRGNNIFASAITIPIFVPAVAAAFMWRLLLDGTVGPIPEILGLAGLRSPSFLGDPTLALVSVIVVDVWQWTPFAFLVILAGMRSISPSTMEAAEIDGAGELDMLRRIVLPSVIPFLLIATLFRSLDLVRDFAKIKVLAEVSVPVLTYRAYERAFYFFQEGIASVYALVVFAIAFVIANLLMRYWGRLFP